MNSRLLFLTALLVSPIAIQTGLGCFCFSMPVCNNPPNSRDGRSVFVGTVIDAYPRAITAYGSMKSFRNEYAPGVLSQRRAAVLRIWNGVLTPEETRGVKRATTLNQLWTALELGMCPRRFRFRVSEWLEGNGGSQFEVFTDFTSCGFKFQIGRQYLVVSYPSVESGRWRTGACTGTALADSKEAREDITALRAWRDGRDFPPRIYGWVRDERTGPSRPDVNVRITGPSLQQDLAPDPDGRFALDQLRREKYLLQVTSPLAHGEPREVDLSHGGCFQADIVISYDAGSVRYDILGLGGWYPPEEPEIQIEPPPFLGPMDVLTMFPLLPQAQSPPPRPQPPRR